MRSKLFWGFGLTAVFSGLAYFYLLPATSYLFQQRTDVMLGDGSDMAALLFMYTVIMETFKAHWTQLLYGAIHTFQMSPPGGFLLWATWIEKSLVPIFYSICNLEQIPAAIGWVLLVANGLSFYLFGRVMKWPRIVSFGLAVAWAFNAFTRARASVHLALAGTFFLPLVFLGVSLLARKPTTRNRVGAATCFLVAVMSQQYFVVVIALLAPFFVIFGRIVGERTRLRDLCRQDFLVLLVPILFLGWNLGNPAPQEFLKNGVAANPPVIAVELFMDVYGAKPIDYLAFDPKHGTRDWNPLRRKINEFIQSDIGSGNEHERSHGIRWSLLLLASWVILVVLWRQGRPLLSDVDRRLIWLFALMGVFCFCTSLSPGRMEFVGIRWSPFLLVNHFYRQFRVPCRFSIGVQFSVIMICGIYLNRIYGVWLQRSKMPKKLYPWIWTILPLVMILDYPPILPIRTYNVLPALTAAEVGGEQCGTGLYFPYFSGISTEITTYYFGLQIVRGTTCRPSNEPVHNERNGEMLKFFSISKYQDSAFNIDRLKIVQDNLIKYLHCSKLDWVYFRREVEDRRWRVETCKKLGWAMVSDRFCRAPGPVNQYESDRTCFDSLH